MPLAGARGGSLAANREAATKAAAVLEMTRIMRGETTAQKALFLIKDGHAGC